LGERDENGEEADPLSCCYCRKPNPSKRCSKRHPKCIKKLYCNETCETLSHKKKEASFFKGIRICCSTFFVVFASTKGVAVFTRINKVLHFFDDRHCFDADPDSTPSFTHFGSSEFFLLLFMTVPVYIVLSFSSAS
jgi:hypothetical protein